MKQTDTKRINCPCEIEKIKNMKNNETLYAISARIPTETYERMNALVEITKKPVSALVHDSIVEYMELVFNEAKYKPSKSLQIDRFAAKIER